MTTTIQCRAQLGSRCQHDEPDALLGDGWRDDGTYDGETIICDPCYLAVMKASPSGKALTEEIPEALRQARAAREGDR